MNKRQYRVGYHEIFPKVPLIINVVKDHGDLWCLSRTVASGHEQRKPAGLLLGVWYWGPQSNSAHCSWLCQLCGGPGGHWAHCYRVPEGNEEEAMVDWAGMQGSQGKLGVTTRKSLSWSGRQGGDTRRHVAFRASAGQNISSHPVLPEAGILFHISDSDIHLVYAVWLKSRRNLEKNLYLREVRQ